MTTIRIEEGVRPSALRQTDSNEPHVTPSNAVSDSIYQLRPLGRSATTGTNDGIYNIRNIRSRSRASPLSRRSTDTSRDPEDEDPGLRRPGDYKHKQVPNSVRWLDL